MVLRRTDKVRYAEALTRGRRTHPLVYSYVLTKVFGKGFFTWEPETLWAEVRMTLGVVLKPHAKNKTHALRACYLTDNPRNHHDQFSAVAIGLSGDTPLLGVTQKPTVAKCVLCLQVFEYTRPDMLVGDEVYQVIAACMADEGIPYSPLTELLPANTYVARLVGDTYVRRVKAALKLPPHKIPKDLLPSVGKVLSLNHLAAKMRTAGKHEVREVSSAT